MTEKAKEYIPELHVMPIIKNFKKGVNWHEWDNIRYDVDTFYDELAWEEVAFINNRLMHRIWFFTPSDFRCPSCEQTQDVKFNIQSTGVCMKCFYCNLTTLAVPYNVGDSGEEGEIAELVSAKEVTVKEALEITARIGQNDEFLQPFVQRTRPDRKRHIHISTEKGGD